LLLSIWALIISLMVRTNTIPSALLPWEETVIEGMEEMRTMPPEERLRLRTTWSHGVLSRGDLSVLFGAATWFTAPDRSALRVSALTIFVVLTAAGLLLLPPSVPQYFPLLFLLHPAAVLYSQYASSAGAGMALSFLLVCLALRQQADDHLFLPASMGALSAVASYEYAPVRFVATLLVFFTVATIAIRRTSVARKMLQLLLLVAPIAAVTVWNMHQGTAHLFYSARGEQMVNFVQQRDYWDQWLGHDHRFETAGVSLVAELLWRVTDKTIPELARLLSPQLTESNLMDPPMISLLFGSISLLVCVGAFAKFPGRPLCIVVVLPVLLLLLLTTRVDLHRIAPLYPLFALLAGNGLALLVQLAQQLPASGTYPRFVAVVPAVVLGIQAVLTAYVFYSIRT
jgi:hypothetical protein